MKQRFTLLLALLILVIINSKANDYILKQANADANGSYLASDSTNWTLDGTTSLNYKPILTSADNVTIPLGVSIAWNNNVSIGTLILNGIIRFGGANSGVTSGTTSANGILTIRSLLGNGWMATTTQSYGIRISVSDAVVNFSGKVTGNVFGFSSNGSIKLIGDLNFQSVPTVAPAAAVAGGTFSTPSATISLTGAKTVKGSDTLLLATALSSSIYVGSFIPAVTGIAPATFVAEISSDRKMVKLSKNAIDTLKAGAVSFSNFYIDLNGYNLTINGSLNGSTNLYFKSSTPAKLTVANTVGSAINLSDSIVLDSLTIRTFSSTSTAIVTNISASNLLINNLNLVSGNLTLIGTSSSVIPSLVYTITKSLNSTNGYVTTTAGTNVVFTNSKPLTLPFGAFGISSGANFRKLTVNGAGIVLSEPTHVLTNLYLYNGPIIGGDFDTLYLPSGVAASGVSNNSYVDGPVSKTFLNAATYTFPVGSAGFYKPFTITASAGGTYIGQVYAVPHINRTNVTAPIASVSKTEYYSFKGTSSVILTFPYHLKIGEVADSSELQIATYSTSAPSWTLVGNSAVVEGNVDSGKVTSDIIVKEGYFAVASTSSTLPVNFLNVLAKAKNEGVSVCWDVAKQINISSFSVQASKDGKNFETIALIPAQELMNYQYLDETVKGNSYYRIVAIDNDGKTTVSAVVVAIANAENNPAISIFPNPTANYLVVTTSGAASFKVINSLGKTVSVPINILSSNKTQLNVASLPSGVYYLVSSLNKISFIKK